MADQIPSNVSGTGIVLPAPNQAPPDQSYDAMVALKKVGWAMASWKAAVASGVAVAPAAVAVIDQISSIISPYGITIRVDLPIFEGALPIIIFAGLVTAHDYAKVRTGAKWL